MAAQKSVLEIIRSTTAWFQKHEVESPRLNAEHLLAHVLKLKRIELYTDFERALFEDELAPLRDLVRRRAAGEPLQHLLGTEEFYGRTFLCDGRALIPRPETERLVEFLLPLLREKAARIVDIGTGSGIIALTLAAELPDAEVFACDLHPAALDLAKENAAKLELGERVQLFQSDLLGSASGTFDLIVANLPYIASGEIPLLSREVQRDPLSALDGGTDGLDLIRRLVLEAPAKLNSRGFLALEIGHDQAQRVHDLLSAANFRDIRIEKDYQDISRFLIATHG